MQHDNHNRLIAMCQVPIIIVIMNKESGSINKKICLKVKFERLKKGLSQEELAFEAGLNRNTIGKIERGEVSPTIETLEKLADAFEIDFLELVDVSKVDL